MHDWENPWAGAQDGAATTLAFVLCTVLGLLAGLACLSFGMGPEPAGYVALVVSGASMAWSFLWGGHD